MAKAEAERSCVIARQDSHVRGRSDYPDYRSRLNKLIIENSVRLEFTFDYARLIFLFNLEFEKAYRGGGGGVNNQIMLRLYSVDSVHSLSIY